MSTISVPTSNLSPAEKSVLEKAFDADVVLFMRKRRAPASAITNWGGSSGCATPAGKRKKKPAKKKAAKKKPARKAAKKTSRKKR